MIGSRRRSFCALLLLAILSTAASACSVRIDENGNGWLTSVPGKISYHVTFDTGPGGLISALDYFELSFSGTQGDVLLKPSGGAVDHVLRFTGSNQFFYYADVPGDNSIANVGLPGSNYSNKKTITEVIPTGSNWTSYTPSAGQPGYCLISGNQITYDIMAAVPSSAPEPPALGLLAVGAVAVGTPVVLRRRRGYGPG